MLSLKNWNYDYCAAMCESHKITILFLKFQWIRLLHSHIKLNMVQAKGCVSFSKLILFWSTSSFKMPHNEQRASNANRWPWFNKVEIWRNFNYVNKKMVLRKRGTLTIAINNVFREITIIKFQLVEKIQHRGNELSNQIHHQVNGARLNRYDFCFFEKRRSLSNDTSHWKHWSQEILRWMTFLRCFFLFTKKKSVNSITTRAILWKCCSFARAISIWIYIKRKIKKGSTCGCGFICVNTQWNYFISLKIGREIKNKTNEQK